MTDLVACLSSKEATWGHLSKVISGIEWGKVYLITTDAFKAKFSCQKQVEFIIIDTKKTILEMAEQIKKALSGKVNDKINLKKPNR